MRTDKALQPYFTQKDGKGEAGETLLSEVLRLRQEVENYKGELDRARRQLAGM